MSMLSRYTPSRRCPVPGAGSGTRTLLRPRSGFPTRPGTPSPSARDAGVIARIAVDREGHRTAVGCRGHDSPPSSMSEPSEGRATAQPSSTLSTLRPMRCGHFREGERLRGAAAGSPRGSRPGKRSRVPASANSTASSRRGTAASLGLVPGRGELPGEHARRPDRRRARSSSFRAGGRGPGAEVAAEGVREVRRPESVAEPGGELQLRRSAERLGK